MISVDKIDREIRELTEEGSMSWDTMEKLCWLYTVRDHLMMDEVGIGIRWTMRILFGE